MGQCVMLLGKAVDSPHSGGDMGTSKLSGKHDEMLFFFLWGGGGVGCNGLASHPGELAILLVTSCYRKPAKALAVWARGPVLRLKMIKEQFILNTDLSIQ